MTRALRPWQAALLAALTAVLVYLPALRNGFAYDDVAVIQLNRAVHDFDLAVLLGGGYWADAELALWRPLTSLSFAVDWWLADGSPRWFHAANLLWHALATALVVLLLARFVRPALALAGGLLFAVHPVHVEAVANVVGRAELIAASALLAAGLLWTRARLGPAALAACVLLFALALAAKESAIMLPALLVLLDAATGALRPASWRAWLRARALPLALLALVGIAYVVARTLVLGNLVPTRLDPALELAPDGLSRIFTALQAWPHHLRLLLFPRTLLADYGPRIIMPAPALNATGLLGAAILGGALVGGVAAWRAGRGILAAALLWVPVAMLPVSNLILPIGVVVAERLLYLPSVAVAIGGALLAGLLGHARWRAPAAALLIAAFALGALRTWTHTPVWLSTNRVMMALLEERPDAFRARWHRARMHRAEQRPDSALAAYRSAVELWPFRQRLIAEAAAYEAERGNIRQARQLSGFAAARWPRDLNAQRLLAASALDLGDTATARAALRAGLALDSTDAVLRRIAASLEKGATAQ